MTQIFQNEKNAIKSLLSQISTEKVKNYDIQFVIRDSKSFISFSKNTIQEYLNGLLNNIDCIEIHLLYIETNKNKYNLFDNSFTKI